MVLSGFFSFSLARSFLLRFQFLFSWLRRVNKTDAYLSMGVLPVHLDTFPLATATPDAEAANRRCAFRGVGQMVSGALAGVAARPRPPRAAGPRFSPTQAVSRL